MQYQEFLDHIYKKYSGNVKLELDRMRGLLHDMGDPQDSLRGWHIAGTNGKGSVCAALEALALAQSLRVGMNTSPHLIDYMERFRVDGRELPFQRVLDEFHRLEELFQKWDASFFEITTAIAFSIFASEKLNCAIMEVGLGGRLDATNLFCPDVAAITTIGLDHVKTLGGTVDLIAAEKAGIIKQGVPLVLGDIEPSPLDVILKAATGCQAPVYRFGADFHAEACALSTAGLRFDYRFQDIYLPALKVNLLGEHQASNVAVALTAFILFARGNGIGVDEDKLRAGLENINWRGRMQVLSSRPVIIADGAHNVHGIKALLLTLDKVFPCRKVRFVVSILADKDYSEMVRLICSKGEKIYVAQNESDRAASVEDQMAEVAKHGIPAVPCSSVTEALAIARAELGEDDVLICGGSLYTVGEVLKAF